MHLHELPTAVRQSHLRRSPCQLDKTLTQKSALDFDQEKILEQVKRVSTRKKFIK